MLATSSIERPRIARTVQAILAEFPHHTSVDALTRLVENGAALDDLVACSEIKQRWREDVTFWVRRDRVGRIAHDPRLRHSLSWRAAAQLIEALGAEAMSRLEDDLLDEWLTMRAPSTEYVMPGWWTLAAFVSSEVCRPDTYRTPPVGWECLDDDVSIERAPRIPAWADPHGRTGLQGTALPPMDVGAWSRPMQKLDKTTTPQTEETDDAG